MSRISLPHQLHVAASLSFALTLWRIYENLRSRSTDVEGAAWQTVSVTSLAVLLCTAVVTAHFLPRRLELWALDRRPFLGAFVVSLIHIYIQMLALQVFVTVLDVWAGLYRDGFWVVPLMPLLWQAWFAPITLSVLLISTVGGGMMLRYLGGRRDYFSH